MGSYIFRRLLAVLGVLLAVSVLVFSISSLLPANVAYLILGPFAPPEQVRGLELRLGLTEKTFSCQRTLLGKSIQLYGTCMISHILLGSGMARYSKRRD